MANPLRRGEHGNTSGAPRQSAPQNGAAAWREGTRDIVTDYLSWEVVVNDGDSILGALQLEERYQISFWDALVIQAARGSGAAVLYSEDLSDGQIYGSIRVVNPLRL
ncbi:MAG TPA: hypothetical protein VGQ46_14030 [Thermoanaerobaculia bacterium]|nr:hypothetical protein [Thermoanaerobaculia bacterium]